MMRLSLHVKAIEVILEAQRGGRIRIAKAERP